MQSSSNPVQMPWWRFPMVWFVIAGPVIVVLAGFATLALAMQGSDSPITAAAKAGSLAPATQARNHAAAAQR